MHAIWVSDSMHIKSWVADTFLSGYQLQQTATDGPKEQLRCWRGRMHDLSMNIRLLAVVIVCDGRSGVTACSRVMSPRLSSVYQGRNGM